MRSFPVGTDYVCKILKFDPSVRTQFDLSSHQVAIHAAALYPIEVKEQMIDWWGPILYEYYAGTEFNGMTFINSEEWLSHKVRLVNLFSGLEILDDNGEQLPPGETGGVYFGGETATTFKYHNDEKKTNDAMTKEGFVPGMWVI